MPRADHPHVLLPARRMPEEVHAPGPGIHVGHRAEGVVLHELPPEPPADEKSAMVENWVDDDLAQVLPAVIYGKWRDAARAAKVIARTSNFGFVQNVLVRGGGSVIMHQVAKKIMKRRGGGDPAEMLSAEMDKFEDWLGEQEFVCGAEPSIGDVATHGCLTCIQDFPAFADIMKRPRVKAWFDRVQKLRDENRVVPPAQAAAN